MLAAPLVTLQLHTADGHPFSLALLDSLNTTAPAMRGVLEDVDPAAAAGPAVSMYDYRLRMRPSTPGANGSVVVVDRYLVPHAGVWRPAMDWLQTSFPAHFAANSTRVADLWGAAQYHDYRGQDYDFALWKQLGFKFYWCAGERQRRGGWWSGLGTGAWEGRGQKGSSSLRQWPQAGWDAWRWNEKAAR